MAGILMQWSTYGLDKAGPNILVGLFNKLKTTTSKVQYFHSFRQASTYLMSHRNGTEQLILDLEAIELHKLSELVKENKGHVTFLNTDCVECWFNEDKPMDISRYGLTIYFGMSPMIQRTMNSDNSPTRLLGPINQQILTGLQVQGKQQC